MIDKMDETIDGAAEKPKHVNPEVDSKYRLILIAAQRSKQLQRGAKPRVTFDTGKHKVTRIALEEIKNNQIEFEIKEEE